MVNKLLLVVFLIASLLLLVDILTPLDVDSLEASSWLVVIAALTGITLFGRFFHRWSTTTTTVTFVLMAALFAVARHFLVWGGDWKTQTIMYQNNHAANRVIEYQMQNPGPGGYNQRTVDKRRLLPGISWLKELNTNPVTLSNSLDTAEWHEVNIEKNELGLVYP
jgi:hypothetical protein